jgi:hypothetical protein
MDSLIYQGQVLKLAPGHPVIEKAQEIKRRMKLSAAQIASQV